MVMTENLMTILYDESLINGDPEKQVKSLATQNKISEDKVIEILERNGCNVEVLMAKRGRPPKNNTKKEIKQAPDLETIVVEKQPMIETTQESINESTDNNKWISLIPKIVFDLVKRKIEYNEKNINFHNQQIEEIKKEQDELTGFLKFQGDTEA